MTENRIKPNSRTGITDSSDVGIESIAPRLRVVRRNSLNGHYFLDGAFQEAERERDALRCGCFRAVAVSLIVGVVLTGIAAIAWKFLSHR